jgi:uncharacterized membrane protein
LLTSKSACTPSFLSVANTSSTAAGELKSAGTAITFVFGAAASISFFVVSSWDCERADMTTASAPANENVVALPFPIPLLPPALVSFEVGGGWGGERTCYDDGSAFCDAFHALAGVNGIVDVMVTGFGETNIR